MLNANSVDMHGFHAFHTRITALDVEVSSGTQPFQSGNIKKD